MLADLELGLPLLTAQLAMTHLRLPFVGIQSLFHTIHIQISMLSSFLVSCVGSVLQGGARASVEDGWEAGI